jgi:hypothetical protein
VREWGTPGSSTQVLETLEVYRRQGEAWLLVLTAGGDDVVRAEPFDAIDLTLSGLWIRPA